MVRVAVTGMGGVTAFGTDWPTIRARLQAGTNAVRYMTEWDAMTDLATRLGAPIDGFEPYLLEWHRRTKRDRPSGTARELARRVAAGFGEDPELEIAVIRAGASPGMHLVGFDSPGETIELRLTARDRSAYAAGALAAADWLSRATRSAGFHPFDEVVDELLAPPAFAAIA